MAKRLIAIIFFITLLGMALRHASDEAIASHEDDFSLSAAVLFGDPWLKEIIGSKKFRSQNACLQKYLKAIHSGSWLLKSDIPENQEKVLQYRRRNLEEQIVVLLGETTRSEAHAFAQAMPFYLEWEGESEGPLTEANFVDNWMSNHSGTSLAPFLYLFKAHRLRAAFECAKASKEKGLWPVLALKYKETLEKALSFNNPLISCIAKDMEAQPYVYLEGYGKP